MTQFRDGPMPRAPQGDPMNRLDAVFMLVLDEIDYGVLIVAASGTVLHANRAMRERRHGSDLVGLDSGRVRVRDSRAMASLYDAIRAATSQRQRRLVSIGAGDQALGISVVPLSVWACGDAAPVLLLVGKPGVCEKLSAHWYAVSHGLTPTERAVLEGLVSGLDPGEIAQSHSVSLSTIRTQIASLRSKTGTSSVGALLRQVARLPPVVTMLHGGDAPAPLLEV